MFELFVPSEAEIDEMYQHERLTEVFPEELAEVAHASDPRKIEFLSGRTCARRALQKLGAPSGPILRDVHGKPGWPDGVVGSITHCHGYRAAAAGWSADLLSIGIDAELNEPLPQGTLRLVASTEELAMITELNRESSEVAWDRLVFSAKESYYKALTTFTNVRFFPSDYRVQVGLDGRDFTAWGVARGNVTPLSGRWHAQEGLLFSVCFQLPPGRAEVASSR
ncbi:4'-phosphopantetheinyl transferase family protein [Leucobacter sp. M11]|uniref:4'-phosphopantetheinyl transferase family protein n=1 Tax=Leucobacter sp. M11 TaxID=2993565 RepID=UPI002D800876|nr:4'-phosphopantetheinyl transferase superfamily protein [Leucobacter sp. M11]MEB4613730.1 4'-phosphopantetheinyl transferase superfamily protein [Leucobacter sp. M11]